MARRVKILVAALLMCLGGITSAATATTTRVYQKTISGNTDVFGWSGVNLTERAGYDGQPAVSPKGDLIAFTSDRAGGNRLFVMRVDGSDVRQITTHDSGYPAWSPDGEKLAYASNGYLRVINLDGTGSRQVGNSWSISRPSWSADGQSLAYAFYAGFNSDIYIIAATAGASESPQRLTNDNSYDQSPSWTLNGTIVFQSNRFGATDNIFAMNSDGSNVRQLTRYTNGSHAILPAVGKSGLVYFVSQKHLFAMTPEGNGLSQISTAETEYIGVEGLVEPTNQALRYTAMGDSVAAGEGTNEGWTWRDGAWGTTTSTPAWEQDPLSPDGQRCHQSTHSYKYLVREALGIAPHQLSDVSCSGASVSNGLLSPQGFGNQRARLSQLDAAYEHEAPNVITLTIGANDVNFSQFLQKCYQPLSRSCNTVKNSIEQLVRLDAQRRNLEQAITSILDRGKRAGATPKIYLTGYFDPFSDIGPGCYDTRLLATASITPSEVAWLRQGLKLLNRNIRQVAARYQEVTYIDVSSAMNGHGFCSADPWVYGPSILLQNPGAGAPYHPTPTGQVSLAMRVIEGMS